MMICLTNPCAAGRSSSKVLHLYLDFALTGSFLQLFLAGEKGKKKQQENMLAS